MKTLYPMPTAITVLPTFNKHARIFLATLLLLVLFLNTKAQVIPEVVFRNPVLINGTAGQNGAQYRFANAAPELDVILEIKNRSASNVVIRNIDLTGFGWDKALQPELGIEGSVAGNQMWWVEFEATFVRTGTNTKRKADHFNVTALDVDGDNVSIREFVQMDKAESVTFSNITNLSVHSPVGGSECDICHQESSLQLCSACNGTGVNAQLQQCSSCNGTGSRYNTCGHAWDGESNQNVQGPVTNFLNIDTAATSVMATYLFQDKDVIKFKLGGTSGASSSTAGVRMNSLWFRTFNLTAPVSTMPVNLTNFTAKLDKKNVLLSWTTSEEKNFNHFMLERSIDGKEFKQTAMIFADDNGQLQKEYGYKDALNNITEGIVYYRLKMVDIDGKFKYSSTRVIRLGEQTEQSTVFTYPNPTRNDLRITIPTSWQDQKVTFELYNVNGQTVKRIVNNKAGQTENLNVADIADGVYIVKVTKGDETAVQRIVKTK
jgi:hypothetical protein